MIKPITKSYFDAFWPEFFSVIKARETYAFDPDMTFVVFIGYGLLSSAFSTMIKSSEKATIAIQKVFAASFAALGLKLALSEQT